MPIFRKAAPQDPLIVAMAGVRLGDRVLILAADDMEMAVDVGARVGLSGRTAVLGGSEDAAARLTARAERRGVLVESGVLESSLPFEPASFDIVIADERRTSGGVLSGALTAGVLDVLRPGGRLIVLRRAASRGIPLPWQSSSDNAADTRELEQRLLAAGFRAARQLATREGTTFVEAARAG